MSFSEDDTERRSRLHYSSGGLDPSGNDGLLPAISGRREDFPQPAVRCGTDGLRAGVVNPPGLTCAALPLTSEGRQHQAMSALRHRQLSAHACKSSS